MIEVQIKDGARIAQQVASFAADYPKTVARTFDTWGKRLLLPELQDEAPVGATGHLQQSIRVWGSLRKEGPMLRAEAPVAQAGYTEFGTKPHPINPRYKKALRIPLRGGAITIGPRLQNGRMLVRGPGFVGQSKGAWGPAVNHPGNAPAPWFFPTIEEWLPSLENTLAEDIAKAAAKALPKPGA